MSAFSPDGTWMVTASATDGTTVREVGSWQARHHREGRAISLFSPDGSLVALAYRPHQPGGQIELVEPASGRQLAILTAPNPDPIAAMAFSHDGSLLAVACNNAHAIQLWDLRSIRHELAKMDLDWDLPDYPPAPAAVESVPLQVEVIPGEL
jgi:WD40 repeat protein